VNIYQGEDDEDYEHMEVSSEEKSGINMID